MVSGLRKCGDTKLSNFFYSEYVALEKLEGMYALDPLFASLLVHGDSTRSCLVAIGVLDPEKAVALVERATGKKVTAADLGLLEKAVQDKKVRQAVLKGLAKVAKQQKLNG
jgi:long-chain acyl-CoA synthetase